MKLTTTLLLKPGITNPNFWSPDRSSQTERNKIRSTVLQRDGNACLYCGHAASKYMHLHHANDTGSSDPAHLITCCVACHAVLHMGRNLSLGVIEIWKTPLSQVEIVRRTREGVASGKTLSQVQKTLRLEKGHYDPGSVEYANDLIASIGSSPRAYLDEPLKAVFVKLKRWQIE
ncbi:MAG: HNH endonuclease [Proteobacteria bacterium]|nr:HNH endonuclease [Pseudomonadota bacterium]